MRSAAHAVALALMIAACACGGSSSSPSAPTSPSTPTVPASSWTGPAIAGNWSGSWTYTVSGLKVTDDVRVTFAAAGTTMTGQLSGSAGVSATLSLTQPSPMSGTASLTIVLLSGSTCVGSGAISGSLNGDELRFQLPSVISVSGGCSVWASDGAFVLKRS
jgi:hypothetical protein